MKRIRIVTMAAVLALLASACSGYDTGANAAATLVGSGTLPPVRTIDIAPTAAATASPTAGITVEIQTAAAQTKTVTPADNATGEPESQPAFAAAKPAAAPQPTAAELNAEAIKFMVKANKYYNSHGFSTNRYKYTAAELKMLAIVIHLEARGESFKAKIAVANVVMNRVLSPGYPGKTIKEVVTRPNQFCYNASVKPTAECVRAAREVLDHEAWAVPQNIYFFRCTKSKSNWGRHTYWGHIGTTAFYSDSYAGRSNSSAIPASLFERTYKWPQYGCKPAARVRKIQVMLNGLGYKVTADGYFGMDTHKAVVKFQTDNKLTADGIAGQATIRTLIKKYGLAKYRKL